MAAPMEVPCSCVEIVAVERRSDTIVIARLPAKATLWIFPTVRFFVYSVKEFFFLHYLLPLIERIERYEFVLDLRHLCQLARGVAELSHEQNQ